MIIVALVVIAYLLGSIPTSLLVARYAKGIDLRHWGSGNLGATNLYRAAGARYASIALITDVCKGFVPAQFFPGLDRVDAPHMALAYGGAALLGHVLPIWVGFRGGKGVATGAGVYLALAPLAMALSGSVWLATMLATRIASLASLLAVITVPATVWFTRQRLDLVFWSTLPVVALLLVRHRSNIARLLSGREPKTGATPGATRAGPDANPTSSQSASGSGAGAGAGA